jgi:tRNA-modifying protein YgfZ
MQDTWQSFLQEQGATIEDNGIINFDNPDINISETTLASPLSGFALLAVSGNDRHAFLHGQLINDLNLIEEPAAQLSAWCNPKGQVITNFLIINTGISYLLLFKQELQEFVQKRLNMFIMRSDVTIEDITKSSPLIGLANTKNLSPIALNIPTNAGEVHAVEGLIIISHPDNSGRYLITGSIKALINKLLELNKSLTMTNSSVWNLSDILSGLPWITSITQERFLPQMLNLDAINGLSYQKGCYPGQEIIARLHYRGEVGKRVQLIKSGHELNIGDDIYQLQSENKVGTIINSELHLDGNCYALAIINLGQINEKLFSDTQANNKIVIIELPYAIDA